MLILNQLAICVKITSMFQLNWDYTRDRWHATVIWRCVVPISVMCGLVARPRSHRQPVAIYMALVITALTAAVSPPPLPPSLSPSQINALFALIADRLWSTGPWWRHVDQTDSDRSTLLSKTEWPTKKYAPLSCFSADFKLLIIFIHQNDREHIKQEKITVITKIALTIAMHSLYIHLISPSIGSSNT